MLNVLLITGQLRERGMQPESRAEGLWLALIREATFRTRYCDFYIDILSVICSVFVIVAYGSIKSSMKMLAMKLI